ncbi:ubiquinone/menaquinone biosynthesis C-methylase UbiE [Hoeflea halophila]|uniref:Ubiquinone/menaquinone biosynthesis C-methylase UbiE n=1 Tax=Hoeflea halophila TaxID=714899 RepID=A0A286IEJ6_9HYPH|nr:class I SAM-dependent methyltransferase [Hoeflea halophila]SOE18447.1 ubiquinone/menaquinone biosynthesis C-methylase UbiE [Hoeflea halophila]
MAFDSFRNSERAGWSERAGLYDDATARATTQAIPAMLAAVRLFHGARVLDAGCGPGYAAGAAAALGARVKGVDFSDEMIAVAGKRFPQLPFEIADVEALDEADNSFDAVVSGMVLYHVTDPPKAICEAYRVLKPGGRYAFSQWSAPSVSPLFGGFLKIVMAHADVAKADPAPDAFLLSDVDHATGLMQQAGFSEIESVQVESVLRAPSDDFYSFFMRFGVRISLILSRQTEAVQATIRESVNSHFSQYAKGGEIHVGMPCIVYSGQKPV